MTRFLSLLWVLLLAPVAQASVVVALSVDDLARRSDLVVLGRVISVSTSWTSDHRHIYRRVTVNPDEAWKGTPSKQVEIVVPGGEIDGVGEKVVGVPSFAEGMRGVFFLEHAGVATLRVIGLSQGFFESSAGGLVQRNEEIAFIHPLATGYRISPHGANAAPPVSVAALRAQVHAALESGRVTP